MKYDQESSVQCQYRLNRSLHRQDFTTDDCGHYFIFHCNDHEVSCRNTEFRLDSKQTGMCNYIFFDLQTQYLARCCVAVKDKLGSS